MKSEKPKEANTLWHVSLSELRSLKFTNWYYEKVEKCKVWKRVIDVNKWKLHRRTCVVEAKFLPPLSAEHFDRPPASKHSVYSAWTTRIYSFTSCFDKLESRPLSLREKMGWDCLRKNMLNKTFMCKKKQKTEDFKRSHDQVKGHRVLSRWSKHKEKLGTYRLQDGRRNMYVTFTVKSKEKSSVHITRSNCEDNINIDLQAEFNVPHLRCVNTICNNETVRLYNTIY
jgi:hypothetical protein